ncbi:Hypothetical protein R9X50_00195300 [Acrodontium crateriforme]|uniref:Ankyrin n=1 Tax=Acrodontium crateriforme TaxID=150365 RepID=A0AAQ3RAI1_9PEZI|nr:Hypothetical protein R9X50_00195300 [Acrodontium crateriforme]
MGITLHAIAELPCLTSGRVFRWETNPPLTVIAPAVIREPKTISLPALPAGVVVREMVSGSLSALKIELPFQAFERNLGNASNMDWQVSNFGKPPYTPLTPRVNESSAGHVRVFGKTIDSPIVSCAVPHDESPAVQQGNKEIIDLIPSDQFSLDMENPPSALFKAASDGNLTRVEHILEQLDPKKPEQLGQALVEAAACKHSDVALRIISSGADVNVFSEVFVDGEWIYGPALFHALYQGDHALCRSLLDSDARVNYRYSKDHPRDENDEAVIADPAIVAAVRSGDEQLVEMIINAGAELNPQVVGFKGLPLAIAIESKNVRVFDLLLRKGCEVNQHRTPAHSGTYRNYADSVLVAAVKTCRIDLVRHVLDKGADPHDEEALVEAVLFEDIFDMILQRHFELYQKERSWGADVLNYAIHESDYGIFEKMSSFGGDPNRLSGSISFSPFGTSIVESEYIGLSFVQYLLNGTDWNCGPETIVSDTTIQSEDNPVSRSTAFLTAIGTGYLPVIELLLKADANVNYPAELGVKRTPLQRAAQVGKIEIVQLLLDYGAEVNAPASLRGGGTALQLAAARGSFPIVRLLHSLNADITADASIVNGRTALEAATEHGRLDILTFLLSEVAGTGPKAVEHASKARSLAEQNGRSYMVEILDAFIRDGSIISQSLPPAQDPNEFSATTAQVPDYNNSDYWEDVDAEALPPTNTEIYQNGISSSPRFSEIFNFDDAMET